MNEHTFDHTISQTGNTYDQTNEKSGYTWWELNRIEFQCNYLRAKRKKPYAYYNSLK